MLRWHKLRNSLLLLLLLLFCQANIQLVSGARGVPGSPEFGSGATIYPGGPMLKEGLALAKDLKLDWICVPVSWAAFQASPSAAPQLEELDAVMQFAAVQQISVLVSISNTPAWALSPKGPDPLQAALFTAELAQRFPAVQAVELFPGANTASGWGSHPDPQAYVQMLQAVHDELQRRNLAVLSVAGGLRPLESGINNNDLDDLVFLQSMYQLGAAGLVQVVSIQFTELTGEPMQALNGSEHRYLRHYEEVRQVMSANQHQKGLIWVTHLKPPSGKIDAKDSVYQDLSAQSSWMSQAYIQLRGQLYMGVAFMSALNPAPDTVEDQIPSLLIRPGSNHPFLPALKQMNEQNQAGSATIKPGKAKDGNFGKNRP